MHAYKEASFLIYIYLPNPYLLNLYHIPMLCFSVRHTTESTPSINYHTFRDYIYHCPHLPYIIMNIPLIMTLNDMESQSTWEDLNVELWIEIKVVLKSLLQFIRTEQKELKVFILGGNGRVASILI